MNFRIDVDQYAVSGQTLGAVARNSVAMIEMSHLVGIEADRFAVVHLYGELAVFVDALHRAQVAVGNA